MSAAGVCIICGEDSGDYGMKLLVIDCFNNYDIRIKPILDFFEYHNYECTYVTSDFDHREKKRYQCLDEKTIQIKVPKYSKNISFKRIISHIIFSYRAYKKMLDLKPDCIYTIVPPNSITWFAKRYKMKYKNTKLIFDIYDLWPETMPIKKLKKSLPFYLWGAIRNKNIKYADLVITECNLFKDILKNYLKETKAETLYLAKREINVVSKPKLSEYEIHLAYLGSINNIIDIPKIKEIIETIKKVKSVTLHIVGDGESRQELIDAAQAGGATVEYHGKIYDSQEKQDIFDKCHFGLNIMKDNVCVGLTMKSIDYFQHGLPIINNIPADTAEIVEKYGVGVNILEDDDIKLKINSLTLEENTILKSRVINLFKEKFSIDAFFENMGNILQNHLSMMAEEDANEFNN